MVPCNTLQHNSIRGEEPAGGSFSDGDNACRRNGSPDGVNVRRGSTCRRSPRAVLTALCLCALSLLCLVQFTGCGTLLALLVPGTSDPAATQALTPDGTPNGTAGDTTDAHAATPGPELLVSPLPDTPRDPFAPGIYPLTDTIRTETAKLLSVYGSDLNGIYNIINDPGRSGTTFFHYDYDDMLTALPGYSVLAEHILTTGHGVCYHYAAMTYYLLVQAGYNACIIHGYRGDDNALHYWTMVETDKGWYHFDPLHHQMLLTDAQKASNVDTRGNGLIWQAGIWPETPDAPYRG